MKSSGVPIFDIASKAKLGVLNGSQEFRLVIGETAWKRFKKIVDREYANGGAAGYCRYMIKASPEAMVWNAFPYVFQEHPISVQRNYWDRINCLWLGYLKYKELL